MSDSLTDIFNTLRPLYSAHADQCVIVQDEPSRYYLGTHEVREKDGYRTGFGGVAINKSYVSAHLMPVYTNPELLDHISAELRKRMQGKSCFNFKKPDTALFAELDNLIKAGITQYTRDGRI